MVFAIGMLAPIAIRLMYTLGALPHMHVHDGNRRHAPRGLASAIHTHSGIHTTPYAGD
jgi:hypothetical protein